MKIEIKETRDRGTDKERIVLNVKEDCQLGEYFVFATEKLPDNKVSSAVRYPYWLPDKLVKKSDLVVIYTKPGDKSFKVNDDKTTTHFFYRNSSTPIYGDKYIAILVLLSAWEMEKK